MSFLYHRNTKRVMKWVWAVLAVLIALSMILLLVPPTLWSSF
ncbi:MAG TPA: hypothetical protein VFL98_02110 [Candidatus Paceibacterota bacterium]|nr:hypothetical protein [Candidatus Paceibacterota bacterium]